MLQFMVISHTAATGLYMGVSTIFSMFYSLKILKEGRQAQASTREDQLCRNPALEVRRNAA
jgi:hypothetical protein